MTEIITFEMDNLKSTCRSCLKVTEEVFIMTPEEINAYQNIAGKDNTSEGKMIICLFCKWMLHKYMKFATQVQRASRLLKDIASMKSEPSLLVQLTTYNIGATPAVILDVGPEDDAQDLMPEDNVEDDDEIPLVMLQDNRSRIEGNAEPQTELKQENDIKRESDTEEFKSPAKRKKIKKELKEGFTSRMRQETEEYLVIKLTVEQVKQELTEKANTEAYLRAPFKCKDCVKGFNFEDILFTHIEKHSPEHGSFQCNICTQYCPSAVSLRGHLKSHTTRYKCKLCGQVRLSRQHLLEHYTLSHTSAHTTYTCDNCDFVSNKRTVIQRHVRSQHGATERHSCHKCGKVFNTIESLRVHTMRHDKSKRHYCGECDKCFVYPSLLHRHVQAVHQSREYYCVECDIKFKSPESMRLHFKKAKRHRDESSYKYSCPHCSERFVSPSTLSVHLSNAHGEEKRHVCDYCSNQYSSKESLRGHIWRVHNNEKQGSPASCHLCEKTFTRKSNLKVHIRSHTGERPYSCKCGATFTQRVSLKVHEAKHTGKDNLPDNGIQNLPQES